ncbi:MAG: hypothetical protein KJN62_08555 [Deltaproteobacteria bacterium]|nr:hypothetical protein [Deltaproteobacteria bacterium]
MKQSLYVKVLLIVIFIFCAGSASYASSKPDIIQYQATYHDDMLSINLQWQSPNPVVMVKVYAGREPKEIEIDEYDNRRNPKGYFGETTVVVNLEPGVERQAVNYVIQLVDDVGQRSRQVSGKVKLVSVASQDAIPLEEPLPEELTPEEIPSQPGDIVDKLLQVAERHDAAPYMHKIKVNIIGDNKVNFTSKATDDKGLGKVIFRIFDRAGKKVREQVLTDLGTVWQGTSKTFTIAAGNYRVVAQAVDSSGSTSREKSNKFKITGADTVLEETDEFDTEETGTVESGGEEEQPTDEGSGDESYEEEDIFDEEETES